DSSPEPVLPPEEYHLLDGYPFGLREEDVDEDGHDGDPAREEEEDSEFEGTEEAEEGLRDGEGEEEVHGDGDALPGRPRLQREYLAGDSPPERPPRPPEGGHEEADDDHHDDG
ncbi:unnamed protein product, partial [Musa acuminata subsp. malaccensis]